MLIATKKNRQLRIPDAKQKEYETLGYTIKNMDGTLVYAPADPEKENAALKAENEALKAELAALKGEEAEAASEETGEGEEAEAETETATTKSTAKKKAAAKSAE